MLLYLGSEVRLEKLVKLFVVVVGEVDAFLLAPVLAVQDQVGVVVEDPLDLDIGILVDTAPLLEELLDAGQPIQPSGIARDDLARLVSSPDRAMQRDQRERHLCVLCSTRSCGSVDNQQVRCKGIQRIPKCHCPTTIPSTRDARDARARLAAARVEVPRCTLLERLEWYGKDARGRV